MFSSWSEKPESNTRQTIWLGILVAVACIAVAAFYPRRADSATTATTVFGGCSHVHKTGYYHATCNMRHPTGFHVTGEAVQPYAVKWVLSCYSTVNNGRISPVPVRYPHHQVVSGSFNLTVSRSKFPLQYNWLLLSARCTLEVTFRRLRPAAAHYLSGLITFNLLPHEVIYDKTAAGQ
jgi:hypothetical protein